MIMHVARDLVREDRLAAARDDGLTDLEASDTRRFGARTFYDSADNADNGVLGDQTDATPEKGAELFAAATDQLVNLLEWLDAQPFADLMPEPHVDPQPGSRRAGRASAATSQPTSGTDPDSDSGSGSNSGSGSDPSSPASSSSSASHNSSAE